MISGKLWAFSGLDGAGKSTQIDRLAAQLDARNLKWKRVWARGGYTPLFSTAKALLRKLKRGALPPPGRSAERRERFRSKSLRRVWLSIAMIDLALYYGLWIRLLCLAGRRVIADRYLEDSAMDFALNFPDEHPSTWLLWRATVAFCPKPDVHFVLVIPVDEALRRSQQKDEPFPDSAEVLAARLAQYETMAGAGRARRLDGRRTREDLQMEIRTACGLES